MTPTIVSTDAAINAQRVFRAVMSAFAEPGTLHTVPAPAHTCPGVSHAATALVDTLLDFETSVAIIAPDPAPIAAHVRFHTGARVVEHPSDAAFALITPISALPPFAAFAQGTLDYPDTSATLIIDVDRLAAGQGWWLTGPGIATERRLSVTPSAARLPLDLVANRTQFPLGVDLIFCAGTTIAALPRSTRVEG